MKRILTIETGLYLLAFLLGLGLRTIQLGAPALSDYEARLALSALQAAQGNLPAWSMLPLYEIVTGGLFFIGGGNDFLARLFPAIVGALLVLSPLLFRRWLGRTGALVCAFGLAIDPALTAASRLAGSPIFAITFSVMAAGFWVNRKSFPAAACLALALLGGAQIWIGLVPFGLSYLLLRFVFKQDPFALQASETAEDETASGKTDFSFWLSAAVVFLAVGTMFFRIPQGLGSFAQSIPAYFQGWTSVPALPLLSAALMLVLYQPLALIFGLAGAGRAWRGGNITGRWLSVWFLLTLVLVLIYPARQGWNLAWVMLPLWALAARELEHAFEIPQSDVLATLGQAALIVILFVLAWLNFAGILITQPTPEAMRMRWILIAGVFVLGLLATVLVGMGWSTSAARTGLVWGLSISLALFVFSSSWAGLQIHRFGEGAPVALSNPVAQWSPPPAAGISPYLVTTLGDLAEWRNGNRRILDVVVVSRDAVCDTCLYTPSIQWALRDFKSVRYVDHLGKGDVPDVVITPLDEKEPALEQTYRGQSFAWWIYPDWQNGIPDDWVRWVLYRNVPSHPERVVLWARSEIFPGGQLMPAANIPTNIQPVIPPVPALP